MSEAKKKELPNIKALEEYRLKGKAIKKGQVVSKKDFSNKSEWRNLISMQPRARAEETADAVGTPSDKKGGGKKAESLPGA